MATTPLERLYFAQGKRCFFCEQPLAKADASVEHLLATANGGDNSDGNCVVCCKAVNRLLGSMQLKDKLKVVLNQRGRFVCPDLHKELAVATPAEVRPARSQPKSQPQPKARSQPPPKPPAHYEKVLANLRKRGNSRPRTLARLKSSIATLFPKDTSADVIDALLTRLQAEGIATVSGVKVAYQLK